MKPKPLRVSNHLIVPCGDSPSAGAAHAVGAMSATATAALSTRACTAAGVSVRERVAGRLVDPDVEVELTLDLQRVTAVWSRPMNETTVPRAPARAVRPERWV